MVELSRATIKVFTLDALADHATHEEFEAIAKQHNMNLFLLGCGGDFTGCTAYVCVGWLGTGVGLVACDGYFIGVDLRHYSPIVAWRIVCIVCRLAGVARG